MSNVSDVNGSFMDYYDYLEEWNEMAHKGSLNYAAMVVIGLVIVVGGFFNVCTVVIAVRRRLWRHDEGYIHLLSILVGNIVIIVIVKVPHWLSLFRQAYHVSLTSNGVCKVWRFLAHVVFATGWYVSALLLGVYLRERLARPRGSQCCKTLAVKYCTPLGSKVTVAVISGALAVVNLWQLWSAELIQINYGDAHSEKMCEVTYEWTPQYYVWEYVSISLTWCLPVIIVVPVLLVMILWTRRGGGGTFAGFSFARMSEDGESEEGGDFARASQYIGLAVSLLQLPIIVIYACLDLGYYHNFEGLFVAYVVAHTVATTHLLVVPVLCLASIARIRSEMKSAVAGKCCPCGDSEEEEEESDLNAILQMDSVTDDRSNHTVQMDSVTEDRSNHTVKMDSVTEDR